MQPLVYDEELFEIPIPQSIFDNWQSAIDHITVTSGCACALLIKVTESQISVLVSSQSPQNPFQMGSTNSKEKKFYCEYVIESQKELLVPNALIDSRWREHPHIELGMVSYCGFPINWPTGQPFGTICLLDNKSNAYTLAQRELLEIFKNMIESSLTVIYQNHNLNKTIEVRTKELKELAYHDQLTGLLNRHSMQEHLERVIKEIKRTEKQYTLLYLDLDGFKIINDTYGHNVGDKVLHNVAHKLKHCVREVDLVARQGGDEFGILLDGVIESKSIIRICNNIIGSVTKPILVGDFEMTISLSIGIAKIPSDACDSVKIIQCADSAMYKAKKQGKGCYYFYTAEKT
jgi:diguanylate cyclase (GGDEF)-like protein